eukprot:1159129-Pelagomonas_calceolata.AAC.8
MSRIPIARWAGQAQMIILQLLCCVYRQGCSMSAEQEPNLVGPSEPRLPGPPPKPPSRERSASFNMDGLTSSLSVVRPQEILGLLPGVQGAWHASVSTPSHTQLLLM